MGSTWAPPAPRLLRAESGLQDAAEGGEEEGVLACQAHEARRPHVSPTAVSSDSGLGFPSECQLHAR